MVVLVNGMRHRLTDHLAIHGDDLVRFALPFPLIPLCLIFLPDLSQNLQRALERLPRMEYGILVLLFPRLGLQIRRPAPIREFPTLAILEDVKLGDRAARLVERPIGTTTTPTLHPHPVYPLHRRFPPVIHAGRMRVGSLFLWTPDGEIRSAAIAHLSLPETGRMRASFTRRGRIDVSKHLHLFLAHEVFLDLAPGQLGLLFLFPSSRPGLYLGDRPAKPRTRGIRRFPRTDGHARRANGARV